MTSLTLLICTYNRVEILSDCLKSVVDGISKGGFDQVEVLVVNNHKSSLSQVTEVINSFNWPINIIQEDTVGLSNARNTGIAQAKGSWIGFVDDDALISTSYLTTALDIIREDSYDCFGGHINSWWKYPRPRWLSPNFGSKPFLREKRESLSSKEYNWGSNIFIKKSALNDIGGFPAYIGMKGNKIGYAAENIVQDQLRAQGFLIGYDPKLSIYHLVLPAKLKLSWHIRSAYATARDGREVFPDDYTLSGYLKTVRRIIAAPVKGLFKLTQTGYHWENWVLDTVTPWAQLVGKVRVFESQIISD